MTVLRKLLNGITSLFSGRHPKNRQVYAITGGKYLGEFFLYIDRDDNNYYFLSMPKMEKRVVTTEKFNYGIVNNIVDPVERVPRNVYELCKEQYKHINN